VSDLNGLPVLDLEYVEDVAAQDRHERGLHRTGQFVEVQGTRRLPFDRRC